MSTWEALRAITLLCLALFVSAGAFPALRPYRRRLTLAALVVYCVALAGLGVWLAVK